MTIKTNVGVRDSVVVPDEVNVGKKHVNTVAEALELT